MTSTPKYYLKTHFLKDQNPEDEDKHTYLYAVVSTFPKYFVFGLYKDEKKAEEEYYDFVLGLEQVDKWCEDHYKEYDYESKESIKEDLKSTNLHDAAQIFHFDIVKVVVGSLFDFGYWNLESNDRKWFHLVSHVSIIRSVLEGKEWRLKDNCKYDGFSNVSWAIGDAIFDDE